MRRHLASIGIATALLATTAAASFAPARYLPAYDGFSATGVSMGVKLRSNPRVFALRNGRTYLFSDAQAKAAFEEDAAGVIAKADANWPAVKRRK
ncbi:MAG: hypothetical protein HYU53_13665 [Acidobacteria bacterium]|nr:hypothetical protein [Acidobacteriota bacterium]